MFNDVLVDVKQNENNNNFRKRKLLKIRIVKL